MIEKLKIGDYVFAFEKIDQIEKNAVGLVRNVVEDSISVFFVGANDVKNTKSENLKWLDIKRTGKPFDQKICNICHILKDNNEFGRESN